MVPDGMKRSFGPGMQMTWLGKRLLLIYGVVYVLELLCEHWFHIPMAALLSLYPIPSDAFGIWQIVTHPFIHDPRAPIGFLINCLVFYFFAAPLEYAMGPARFLKLFYLSAAGAAVCGLAFAGVSGFSAPFSGMLPSILAMVVVFGLLNPEATILLMFILPVRAKYISHGTLLMTFILFLAKANPHGAYHLGGMICGYLYFKGAGNLFDTSALRLRYLKWKYERKKARFRVIEGRKKKNDDKPTYH